MDELALPDGAAIGHSVDTIEEGVADVALVANGLPVLVDVAAVVAPVTSWGGQMTDVLRVSPPVDVHIREEVAFVDLPDLVDGPVD